MHMCEGNPEYRNQRFLYLYQISLGHSLPYFLVKILYHFPFPPSKLFHVPRPLARSQNDGLFSLLLLCICVCMWVCLCIFMYKYNLLTPFSVTCLCGISGLNIWYWITKEGLIPGETSSPAIRITCLQFFDYRWDPSMSPFHTSMSTGAILQFLLRKPYWWDIIGEDFCHF